MHSKFSSEAKNGIYLSLYLRALCKVHCEAETEDCLYLIEKQIVTCSLICYR